MPAIERSYCKRYERVFKWFLEIQAALKGAGSQGRKGALPEVFLGLLWTLLNPLFMMIIMTVVFSHVFRANIEYFPAYLLAGQICMNFLTNRRPAP